MTETTNPATPNAVRGEFAIALEGVDHVMRPAWDAILAFETTLGKSLIVLAKNATEGALTLRELGTIACECIRAYGRQKEDPTHAGVNDRRVLQLIADLGVLHALKPIQQMLILAATGGVTSTGEVKAVATETPAGTATAA